MRGGRRPTLPTVARLSERGRHFVARLRETQPRPETLLRMRPGLGDNVHFRVRFRQSLDAVGIARATEYTYLGPAAEQVSLPLD